MNAYSASYLDSLRAAELKLVLSLFPPKGARVLEIGAGRGHQAALLRQSGFDVEAIELKDSPYQERLFPVANYDGSTIPFADRSFDVVYSSNVLEHIPHLDRIHSEILRVL